MNQPEDVIHHNVNVYLGWQDRLKVLFGVGLHVDSLIETEHRPGEIHGLARVWLENWPWQRNPILRDVAPGEGSPEDARGPGVF